MATVKFTVSFKPFLGGNGELRLRFLSMLILIPSGMLSLIMNTSLISYQILFGGNLSRPCLDLLI